MSMAIAGSSSNCEICIRSLCARVSLAMTAPGTCGGRDPFHFLSQDTTLFRRARAPFVLEDRLPVLNAMLPTNAVSVKALSSPEKFWRWSLKTRMLGKHVPHQSLLPLQIYSSDSMTYCSTSTIYIYSNIPWTSLKIILLKLFGGCKNELESRASQTRRSSRFSSKLGPFSEAWHKAKRPFPSQFPFIPALLLRTSIFVTMYSIFHDHFIAHKDL